LFIVRLTTAQACVRLHHSKSARQRAIRKGRRNFFSQRRKRHAFAWRSCSSNDPDHGGDSFRSGRAL